MATSSPISNAKQTYIEQTLSKLQQSRSSFTSRWRPSSS